MKEHVINQVIRHSNEFIYETFIRPNDQQVNIDKIKTICSYFNFRLPKNVIAEPQQVKSKEFQTFAKERMLQRLYEVINKENSVQEEVILASQQGLRKFYVGRGNNYALVRSIFKQRWWWQLGSGIDFETSNFLWT